MRYIVHSSVSQPVSVAAKTADGRDVTAALPGQVVELLPDGHTSGSITLRFQPADSDEHKALAAKYSVGSKIIAGFELEGD